MYNKDTHIYVAIPYTYVAIQQHTFFLKEVMYLAKNYVQFLTKTAQFQKIVV